MLLLNIICSIDRMQELQADMWYDLQKGAAQSTAINTTLITEQSDMAALESYLARLQRGLHKARRLITASAQLATADSCIATAQSALAAMQQRVSATGVTEVLWELAPLQEQRVEQKQPVRKMLLALHNFFSKRLEQLVARKKFNPKSDTEVDFCTVLQIWVLVLLVVKS
jgi:predicted  nucleic acid-binding Zn-ribbon protein